MAITHTLLTEGHSDTDGTVFNAASVTFPTGKTILLYTFFERSGTGSLPTFGNAPAGGFALVTDGTNSADKEWNSIAGKSSRTRVYRALGDGSTGALSLTFGTTMIGVHWHLYAVDGDDTSSPILSVASDATDSMSTAPLATLGAAGDATVGFIVSKSTGAATAGSGFAIGSNQAGAAPVRRSIVEFVAGGDTTVDATMGNERWCAIALGLRAAPSATQLAMDTQPAGAVDSVAFTIQPTIQLKDAGGNNAAQAGVTITATIQTGSGTLAGTATADTDATGLATFTDLEIDGYGNHSLHFAATGLTAVDSDVIFVSGAGPATKVKLTVQPAVAVPADVAISPAPAAALYNVSDQRVWSAAVDIDVAILDGAGDGTLNGTTTQPTNAQGEATFPGLSITLTAGVAVFSLQVSSGALTPEASIDFAVYPASAAGVSALLGDGVGLLG